MKTLEEIKKEYDGKFLYGQVGGNDYEMSEEALAITLDNKVNDIWQFIEEAIKEAEEQLYLELLKEKRCEECDLPMSLCSVNGMTTVYKKKHGKVNPYWKDFVKHMSEDYE